jgi:hypothetical protein
MNRLLPAIAAGLALLTSCSKKREVSPSPSAITAEPLAPRAKLTAGAKRFQSILPQQSGVTFVNGLVLDHPLARLYFSGFACGGVVMADFNGDTRNDLFFTGGPGDNGLFLQTEKPLKFTDASATSGITGANLWSGGAVAVDIDDDGDNDLLVCNYDAPPNLFINDGAAKFTDRAAECGITHADAYLMPIVCDYDRDGDLDIYLVANQLYLKGGRPAEPPYQDGPDGIPHVKAEFTRYFRIIGKPGGAYTMDTSGRPDLLLRNDSTGAGLPKFTDATSAAGLSKPGFGLSATWWDFNNDGWPDLHVGNDFSDPDLLYLNRGDGTFTDIAAAALPHSAWFSMGADTADVDGDGLDDLFCADMAFTTHYKQKVGMGQMGAHQAILEAIQPLQVMRNHLFINTGSGPFREAGQMAGISKTDWTWAVKFADLDLDGAHDLFVANGAIRSFNHSDFNVTDAQRVGQTKWDLWKNTPSRPEANLAFRNLGDLQFEETGNAWGLDDTGVSHGLACGDLDGDGDPDIVVTNIDKTVSIFRNDSDGSLITIRLEGGGVGAKIEIEVNGKKQQTSIRPSSGYLTTSPAEVTFGLGEAKAVDRLHITWPNARTQSFENLASGQCYFIRQNPSNPPAPPEPVSPPLFDPPARVASVTHSEAIYDDFSKQPLLPHKLSQQGAATAWADIDGDGDLDLFHGGASGSPGTLFRNEGAGKLTPISCPALDLAAQSEDAAAAFFDADANGTLDLYVASGSYENDPNDPALQDRLYLNDGKGNFSATDGLPDLRDVGSCVRPSDYDGDGDIDLFIGSRVLPGEYPLPATSRLLKNETPKGGAVRFVEVEHPFKNIGLVTDAVWADVDGDKRDDLMVTLEWGAVQLFKNTTSDLKPVSAPGWWTRIAANDIDNDGDIDFAVGNFGLNTKYHASKEHPALLFYGDLIGDGNRNIIEAEYENDTLFPVRGKSCSTAAMPTLKGKFQTFHDFAGSTLEQIYPGDRIKAANRFECHTLESGFLINDGTGNFNFRPLPRIAQIAPIQGFAFADFDHDGQTDLAIAQNFYNPQFETGPYAGGTGLLLKGDGKGNFTPLHTRDSGILLRGDPRGLHAIDLDNDGALDLICPLNNGPMIWQHARPRR